MRISLGRDFARALDPCILARDCGIVPDATQSQLLTTTARKTLVCCCRQWGKSTITAIVALHEALYGAPAMVVVISPSQPQSTELFKKIHGFWEKLPGAPAAEQESLTRMELANGSRIISLPGSEKTVRGYSAATLVIMDEAARVPDELLASVRPMLATTSGRFIALSTPAGKRGWYYEQWERGEDWARFSVKGVDCARIAPAFLAEELQALGPLLYSQEYEIQFVDQNTSAFSTVLIEMALRDDFRPFI
ncbi:Helicase [Bradyrhizobium erythrophlei]|nr:Helicase [Bradyrhizobium erythrophlei]